MTTRVTLGSAQGAAPKTMGEQAASQAKEGLEVPPLLGIVFATSKVDLGELAQGVASVLGDTPVIGCSSAGEFAGEQISDGGVALGLIASDEMGVSVGLARGLRASTDRAVRDLVGALKRGRKGPAAGASHRTILLLTDGMAGNGEPLVDALSMEAGASIGVVGGAAGDDGAFQETFVFLGDEVAKDAAVAAELTTPKKIGVGVFHGWCAASEPGEVTKSEGARLIEIDGKPAIDFYAAYAKQKGVELTEENQNEFVFTHELGIVLMNDELKVRAPLSVNEDGSINCATEVPVGQKVRVVEGDHDAIVTAAKTAAEQAVEGLGGQPCAGAIVFDCVARKLVLGDGFSREVEAFRDVLKAPVMGFNTYGEIAKVRGQLSGFHNTTAVVAALPA